MAALVLAGFALASSAHGAYEAPDPGGDETAVVPVPPQGKFFGFNDPSYLIPQRGVDAEELAALGKGAGANVARINLDWRYLEPSRDQWSESTWAQHDAYYDALVRRGITPLLTIGFAPIWARDANGQLCFSHSDCEFPPARHMLGEWREFAAEVTRRFPAAAISVWNEPNIYQFWTYPNPERWAELVAEAHDAIKAVNPSAPVIAGGLSINQGSASSWRFGTSIPLREFLWRAYQASPSIKGNMNAIGLNSSSGGSLAFGEDTLFAKGLHDIRTVRRDFNDDQRPIWITETSLSTTGPGAFSQAQQADGLLRQYRRLMTMDDVRAMIIHTLIDRTEAAPGSWDVGVGVTMISPVTRQVVPKLAYCEFAGRVKTATPALGCPRIDESGDAPSAPPPEPEPPPPTGDDPPDETTGCEPRLSRLKARRTTLRDRRAVYLPYARAGHEESRQAVRRLNKRLDRVKGLIRQHRQRCR